jgi:hypothetical protein
MAIRVLLTAANDSSGTYRIDSPAQAVLRRSPDEFRVRIAGPSSNPDLVLNKGGLPINVDADGAYVKLRPEAFACDLVVLQRPMYYWMPRAIEEFHAHGIPVIVELDDDFHTAHPENRAFMLNHPKVNALYNWNFLSASIRKADHVTVSTTQLARRYGSHGRVSVLRNCVADAWLEIPHTAGTRRLGWPGTVVNHPTDPQQTKGAIADLLDREEGWDFYCIGGGGEYRGDVIRAFELDRHADRVVTTAWRSLEFHPFLVTTIDVGVVPLWTSVFNEAKSWLKGLEFAALGIPFVASETTEYRALAEEHDLGVTVPNRRKNWTRELKRLMAVDRRQLGDRMREQVRRSLTMSANGWRWAEVWQDVVDRGVIRARAA